MYEGIYLIQEREFIKTCENIYKIGRSHNLDERIKQYPKQSKLFLIILCKNSYTIEKELVVLLTNKFKLCIDYGAEYFEGKLNNIIKEIENYFKNKKGLQLKKYTINSIIPYMINVLNTYNKKEELLLEIYAFLTNPNTHKRIILNMSPELRLDDKYLE